MTDIAAERATIIDAPPRDARFSVTIARTTLRDTLAKLLTVVPTKPSVPVITCVLIDVQETVDALIEGAGDTARQPRRISLTATNLDATIRLTIMADVTGQGRAALPARRLADIVANLPAGVSIVLTVDGTQATLRAGRATFKLTGVEPSEFPQYESGATGETVQGLPVVASTFLSAVVRAARFTQREESSRALDAVCVDIAGGNIAVAATDGHILARLPAGSITGATSSTTKRQHLLYGAMVPAMTKLFGELAEDATLTIGAVESRAIIEADGIRLDIRLIDGPFPAYAQLLKQTPRHTIVCNRENLAQTIRRVALAAPSMRRIVCTIAAHDDELWIRAAEENEKGEDMVLIEAHDRHGDAPSEFSFAVHATKLLTALDALLVERVQLSFDKPEAAIHVRVAGQDVADPTLALVMPLRLIL